MSFFGKETQLPIEMFMALLKSFGDDSAKQGALNLMDEPPRGHKFNLKYKIEPGEWTREQIEAEKAGGCNAMLLVSIARGAEPHGGMKSFNMVTMDGFSGREIPDTEIFQIFSVLSDYLAQSKNLLPWQSLLASETIETVKKKLKSLRERGQAEG